MDIEKRELGNQLELISNSIQDMLQNELKAFSVFLKRSDSNLYVVDIFENKERLYSIKILQILKLVKVFIYDTRINRSWSLVLSIEKFFKPMLRNSIIIDQYRRLQDYFNPGRYDKLRDLLKCRIANKLQKKEPNSINKLTKGEVLFICKYLTKKSIYNLLKCNTLLYAYYLDNNFWMQLYNTRFKKTGFKPDQVNWRSIFINKSS